MTLSNFRVRIISICILVLAFVLRIYQLGSNPPSLSWDEASIGYNAYSILKLGLDEHKRFLPLDTFPAFGDYKPPIPIYLTVPFIAIFGLNEFAIRLPSAVFGILTVLMTYLLVLELFQKKSFRIEVALISAALLAISPWHVNLSRAAFEANIAVFFVLLGVWLIFKSRQNSRLWLVIWLPFVACIYTFNSTRYFVPILSLVFLALLRKNIADNKKLFSLGIVTAVLFTLPILPHLLSKESRLRFTEVNIFNDYPLIEQTNNRITYDGNTLFARIVHNRRVVYFRSYLIHFFDHFEPRFLFVRGDGNPKFSIQDVGQLYWIEAPFLLLGVLFLFSLDKRLASFLLFWIIAAIIPAAFAKETPHALRIENTLPVWQIFVAYGFVSVLHHIQKKKMKYLMVMIVVMLLLGNFGYYLHNYYRHYPKAYSGEWQYGYKQAIVYAKNHKNAYDTIVISDSIGRPYIYALFYEQYDPNKFWETRDATFDAAGFYNVYGFDKYRFTKGGMTERHGKTLYILQPNEVPVGASILETIQLLNGQPVLVIFET